MKSLRKIKGDRTGLEQLVKWIGVVAIVVSLGLIYVWQQIQTRDLKRDILDLEEQKLLLIKENSRLSVQVSRLSGEEAVKNRARELFALHYPAVGQVVALGSLDRTTEFASAPEIENTLRTSRANTVLPMASVSMTAGSQD